MVDLNSDALITLDNFKIYRGITGSTTEDDRIKLLINSCSIQFESACKRKIISATYTEYHDGMGDDAIMLHQYPVTSVTSVYDDPDRDYESGDLVDSDDYMYDEDSGILRLEGGVFQNSKQNVKVTYVAGFTSTPDDIEIALYDWVAMRLHKAQKRWHGIGSDSVGDHNIVYLNEKMPKEVQSVVENYKIIGRQQMHG